MIQIEKLFFAFITKSFTKQLKINTNKRLVVDGTLKKVEKSDSIISNSLRRLKHFTSILTGKVFQ